MRRLDQNDLTGGVLVDEAQMTAQQLHADHGRNQTFRPVQLALQLRFT